MSQTQTSCSKNPWLGWRRIVSVFLSLLVPIAFVPVMAVTQFTDGSGMWMIIPGTVMTTIMATGFIVGMGIALSEPESGVNAPTSVLTAKSKPQRRELRRAA